MITDDDDLAPLRELLHATELAPQQGLEALLAARTAAAGTGALGRDVLEAEGRWLQRKVAGQPSLTADAAAATAALQGLRARACAAADMADVDALFELAALAAEHRAAGDAAAALALEPATLARAAAVADAAPLLQEADERWAAQSLVDEEQPLQKQIAVLRGTGQLLARLAERHGSKALRRRARRSLRAADDRELQARLEGLLGRRGVVWLETTSFLLLIVVLLVIVAESVFAPTPAQARALLWVDAVACAYFVAEFAFKLALAPHRGSWFLRNVVTDLLPAIPAALFLLPGAGLGVPGEDAAALRVLRLLRITWAARYVQALRPLLRLFRLALLLVRGMDGLVRRFQALLDRNFVFLGGGSRLTVAGEGRRDLVFAALRREQSLVLALPPGVRGDVLAARLRDFTARAQTLPGSWAAPVDQAAARDVAVDSACEFLWSLQPADLARHLSSADVRAIDRVVRVLRTPPIAWLPLLRVFVVRPLPASPEERVVALGRRVADWLMGWQDRLQFVADLHGIVTGPQILDRVASAMVKASQRPAYRLLFFGGLFSVLNLFWEENCLSRIVGMPLLVLGSVCLVFLTIGWWLKRVAGEASETFRLISEAHFVSQMHVVKRRHEAEDLRFLGRRAFADAVPGDCAQLLKHQLQGTRTGVPVDIEGFDARAEHLGSRVALLYLHFLDGALLHSSDVKTTEQLLANLSLENLRHAHLGYSRRDKKRLRQLRLDDGSVLRGPFLWFRFITESIAVETSKRITEYNRRCVPLPRRASLDRSQQQALAEWLQRRCDPKAGRTLERLPPPDAGTVYATTEFHALHFLCIDEARDEHVRAMFGDDVLAALRADRRNMIREIFGTRPTSASAGVTTSFNAWRFYWSKLSHGRVLLVPLFFVVRVLRSIGWMIGRVRQIVREVLTPHLAMARREPGTATFAVALRKIHRMKAPGLLEAIRTRLRLDPLYGGAPAGWSLGAAVPERVPELERDLDFLLLPERERAAFRRQAQENRELVARLHAARSWLPELGDPAASPAARSDGELAVTVAWMANRASVRTLLAAESWRLDELPATLQHRPRIGLLRRLCWTVADVFVAHPVDVWVVRQRVPCSRRSRRALRVAYAEQPRVRATIDAWNRLAPGVGPAQAAVDGLRGAYADGEELRRELVSLRTVQSLSVLDVRNYRDVVYELGGYADDGEDPAPARRLP